MPPRGASCSTLSRSAGFYRKAQLHDRAQVWDFGLYRLGNVLRIKDYPRFPLPNTGLFTRAVGLSHRPRRENGVRFIDPEESDGLESGRCSRRVPYQMFRNGTYHQWTPWVCSST